MGLGLGLGLSPNRGALEVERELRGRALEAIGRRRGGLLPEAAEEAVQRLHRRRRQPAVDGRRLVEMSFMTSS